MPAIELLSYIEARVDGKRYVDESATFMKHFVYPVDK